MALFHIFKQSVIGFIAVFALTTTVYAQSTILVVDQGRVLRESTVGKHVKRQIESIGKSMESEMKSQATPLTSERDRLANELKNMDKNALASRPDLQKRAQDLMQKGQKQQIEAAYKERELAITQQKAIAKVNAQLAKILETIVAERNADIVLDRSLVIYGGKSIDVTDTVLSRLNAQLKTVSVTRERLPRQ